MESSLDEPDRGKSDGREIRRLPTLADLAKAAGVSRTTASNAFNRPDQLSAELRERVLATAQTLGYAGPNPMARMLRTGRAGALGLVFSDSIPYALTDPASLAQLRGIGEVCEREHEAIVILPVGQKLSVPPAVLTAAVDGFLAYCLPDNAPVLKALAERQLPVVGIDQHDFSLGPSVVIDDIAAALEACRHLTALGHRRIGTLCLDLFYQSQGGPIDLGLIDQMEFQNSKRRLRGYLQGMLEAAVDPLPQFTVEVPHNSRARAEKIVRSWLEGNNPPTAILAMSDQLALGALRAATSLGVSVPERLSIVGFDDTELAVMANPPLTTIQQPITEKGRLAATLLLEARRRGNFQLDTELVVRESTAPPSR